MKTQPQRTSNEFKQRPARSRALNLAQRRHAKSAALKPRSFLSIEDISCEEMKTLLQTALDMKLRPEDYCAVLRDKSVALLFQKTSTRTRCSFETAVVEMGGYPTAIDWRSSNFVLAALEDEIKVLSRYYDVIMARVMDHATLVTMAAYSEVPVINGLCNLMHPCQALGDYLTIAEYFGPDLCGLKLAYIGDGNNVCRSLVHGAVKLGIGMNICTPPKYALDDATVATAGDLVALINDPADAVHDADVIYTDTWVSMGNESETQERHAIFAPYQVNEALMERAPSHALFMHCLPAHPGFEVTPGVLRSARSIVFDQAENRKHAQKALMMMLARP